MPAEAQRIFEDVKGAGRRGRRPGPSGLRAEAGRDRIRTSDVAVLPNRGGASWLSPSDRPDIVVLRAPRGAALATRHAGGHRRGGVAPCAVGRPARRYRTGASRLCSGRNRLKGRISLLTISVVSDTFRSIARWAQQLSGQANAIEPDDPGRRVEERGLDVPHAPGFVSSTATEIVDGGHRRFLRRRDGETDLLGATDRDCNVAAGSTGCDYGLW